MKGRARGRGQAPPEEAPHRERTIEDVMLIHDLRRQNHIQQRQIDELTRRLALRDLQRKVAKLTRRLAAKNIKAHKALVHDSQPAFKVPYNGDSSDWKERYGGASLKEDVPDYSGMSSCGNFSDFIDDEEEVIVEKTEETYYGPLFHENITSSCEQEVDWTKPPVYDDYGDDDVEALIMEDDKHTIDFQIEVISNSCPLVCSSIIDIQERHEEEVVMKESKELIIVPFKLPSLYCDPFLEHLILPMKLPSLYCDPFLEYSFAKVPKLNSRTSSFEEGVTDAGGFSKSSSSVSGKQLFRSKRRIRGRIEGMSETGRILYDFGWKRRSKENPCKHGHHPISVKFSRLGV